MFEAITQTQPEDYQSLEILREAYTKIGRHDEALRTSRKLAEAYFNAGSYTPALPGGVSGLVGKGDHAIISIFNQAPIMPRLATTRISGTLPSCLPPKSISSNPRFGFGRRSIRR